LLSIGKYNWGVALYETFAKNLNEGLQKIWNGIFFVQLHISGL
jgi:hypothetical protein